MHFLVDNIRFKFSSDEYQIYFYCLNLKFRDFYTILTYICDIEFIPKINSFIQYLFLGGAQSRASKHLKSSVMHGLATDTLCIISFCISE